MSEAFIGEIRMFGFNFPPRDWALCNGQIMSISQNAALFSILGTTYGGNGTTTFALPNLQGRTPIHVGVSVLGQLAGEEAHVLLQSEMAPHLHQMVASSATAADQVSPAAHLWANGGHAAYASAPATATMHSDTVGVTGGSQPHENRSPFLVVSFCIALFGVFPSH
jgi:microcystin-dependent protein